MAARDALDAMDSLGAACSHIRGIAELVAFADLKDVPDHTVARAAEAMLKHLDQADTAAADLQAALPPEGGSAMTAPESIPMQPSTSQSDFKTWDPSNEQGPIGTHGPVLTGPLIAQVGQDDLYVDVQVLPGGHIDLSAALLPADSMAEMIVSLPSLSAGAALALAQALVWAAQVAASDPAVCTASQVAGETGEPMAASPNAPAPNADVGESAAVQP